MRLQTTKLRIEEMTCQSCVRRVREALLPLEGVRAVDVSLADGLAVVRHDESASVAPMIAALDRAGYAAAAQ